MGSTDRRRHSSEAPGPAALAFAALAFLGCGGTTVGKTSTHGTPDGPGGASNAGGHSNGTGGNLIIGNGGRLSIGGASSTGGAPDCGLVFCPAITCATGYISFTPPGACCADCRRDCGIVDCVPSGCPPGMMTYIPPGQCCPVCGPDCSLVDCAPSVCPPGSAMVPTPYACCGTCATVDSGAPVCNPGFDAFLSARIVSLQALSCTTSNDCTIVPLDILCRHDCGTVVNIAASNAVMKAASAFSAANCAGCPETIGACPRSNTAECQNGQCVRAP